MGMYDESWCSSCGTSITYTADESATCGECVQEEFTEFKKILYSVVHSTEQSDLDKIEDLKEWLRLKDINND